MELTDFLQIAVVGAALSVGIQLIKKRWAMSSVQAKSIVIASSIALGYGYWFFKDTNVWQSMAEVLGSATVVYNFILKKKTPEAL